MEWLFGKDNHSIDSSIDSMDSQPSVDVNESADQLDNGFPRMTTTIERSLDLSPIRKTSAKDDYSYGSLYEFDDEDLSFDKSKSSRKYFSGKKSLQFSPISGSTPKPSKTKRVRRTQTKRKKSYKTKCSDISLWDKAIIKNVSIHLTDVYFNFLNY